MPKEIDIYEAKAKLSEILLKVEAGEAFTITNKGKAVADIVANHTNSKRRRLLAIDNILKAKKHGMNNLNELKEAGQK